MIICRNCKKEFSNRCKINGKIRMLNKRKYCLDCSPFGLHRTRPIESKPEIGKIPNFKICGKCKQNKPSDEFYKRRNNSSLSSYCKKCSNKECQDRAIKFKLMAIKYKGGSCKKCGYNKCNNALEFHHINPKIKDFSIGLLRKRDFNNIVKKELDKCDLLCANCHREEHMLLNDLKMVSPTGLEPA